VAVFGDHVVGFASLADVSSESLELEDLFVDPHWHRHGIGRSLVADLIETARRSGRRRIEVTGNPHALAFYRSVGFVEIGEVATDLGPAPRLRLDLT
jgi:GNAT superfamily N-acetyltransferase